MHSRLGIASFLIGIAVGVGYAVIRILLPFSPDGMTVLSLNLGFMIGASIAGLAGLALGLAGWLLAHRRGRKPGFAILGAALGLAVIAWAVTAWIGWFFIPESLPGA